MRNMTFEDATSRCWLEVDLDSIRENYRTACAMVQDDVRIIPVLKANAYGMNAVEIARVLHAEGAKLFAVATTDESEQLLSALPDIEVLPMGLAGDGAIRRMIRRGMPLTLFTQKQGRRIAQIASELGMKARVHIKVDTGLHRLGLEPEEAADFIAELCREGNIEPVGMYTHLAIHTAEMDHIQVSKLRMVRQQLAELGVDVPLVHAVDSIGMVRYPDERLGGARIGAWLYGVCPRNAPAKCISPARFKARVSQVRKVACGELIGYDDDFPLTRDSVIATVSAGYVDGTPRTGDKWQAEVRGMRADVVGIACMDQLMLDVTDIPGVEEGDEVTFVGGVIGVDEYAEMGHLNRNEAWARIGRRVPRVFYENGKPVRICAEV